MDEAQWRAEAELARTRAEVERLREEVDQLRDFILSRAMSAEDYAAFKRIESYAVRNVLDTAGKRASDA
jgi:hypothetical protein